MERIQAAYPAEIYQRIGKAVSNHPDPNGLLSLFGDIAALVSPVAPASQPAAANGATNSKKRKLENGASECAGGSSGAVRDADLITAFECKDVSFQAPARKKLKLQVVRDKQDSRRQEVRLRNQQSGEVDHTLGAEQVDEVFCLPVPEKQTLQWNFVVFPKPGATTVEGLSCEPMVFTMNPTPPAGAQSGDGDGREGDTYVTVTERALNKLLQPQQGKRVVIPDSAEFESAVQEPQRKKLKVPTYSVKAFRGSKDGYLFFLPNGIVFGFKKPLAFFPFSAVESVSYTSVLQRTFNLVISHRDTAEADVKDVEFSMIDQADFAGIDDYIKRHELNDASMAAERRAKVYGVNKKAAEANGDAAAGGVEEAGILQKTEEQLQDEEDEEEEDYVESGGESDGEGEESDEDGEEYEDGEDAEGEEEMEDEDEEVKGEEE